MLSNNRNNRNGSQNNGNGSPNNRNRSQNNGNGSPNNVDAQNSKILKLFKEYIGVYKLDYTGLTSNNKSVHVTINNKAGWRDLSARRISLLKSAQELHQISLKKFPTLDDVLSQSHDHADQTMIGSLPLVVFQDYPRCTKPIMYKNVREDSIEFYIRKENETEEWQLTYMMYYCLPFVSGYLTANRFFKRSTRGLELAGCVTPFEINYPNYFNYTGSLYRKLGNDGSEHAGEWSVIHLLCSLHSGIQNYKEGLTLLNDLCGVSIQSLDDLYPSKIIDLNQVVNSLTPIGRILSSLDYTCLPFFDGNTIDHITKPNGNISDEIIEYQDKTRPVYINTLMYYRNIHNSDEGKVVQNRSENDPLRKGIYVEPNTTVLRELLKYDIDVNKESIKVHSEEVSELLPIEFCCHNGYYMCLGLFLTNKPDLLDKNLSFYLNLIDIGFKLELERFTNDENMIEYLMKIIYNDVKNVTQNVTQNNLTGLVDELYGLLQANNRGSVNLIDKIKEWMKKINSTRQIPPDLKTSFPFIYLQNVVKAFRNTRKKIVDFKEKQENTKNMNYQINIEDFEKIRDIVDFQEKLKRDFKKSELTQKQKNKIQTKIRKKTLRNEINSMNHYEKLNNFKKRLLKKYKGNDEESKELNNLLRNGTELRKRFNKQNLLNKQLNTVEANTAEAKAKKKEEEQIERWVKGPNAFLSKAIEAKAIKADPKKANKAEANAKANANRNEKKAHKADAIKAHANQAEINKVNNTLFIRSKTRDTFGRACNMALTLKDDGDIVSLDDYRKRIDGREMKKSTNTCGFCLKSGNINPCQRCTVRCCRKCSIDVSSTKLTRHLSSQNHLKTHLKQNNGNLKLTQGALLYSGTFYPSFMKDGAEKLTATSYKVCPLCWAYTELQEENERKIAKLLGGGKSAKKVRKHQGIYQRGPKKGRLKPGFKYSSKKTKTGLKIIIKVKK